MVEVIGVLMLSAGKGRFTVELPPPPPQLIRISKKNGRYKKCTWLLMALVYFMAALHSKNSFYLLNEIIFIC
jgi:hypothetical protein